MVNTGNWGKCVQINGMIASEPASMKKEPQAYPEATPSTGGALPQRRGFMSNSDLDLGRKPGGDHGARLGAGAGGLLFLPALLAVRSNVGCEWPPNQGAAMPPQL